VSRSRGTRGVVSAESRPLDEITSAGGPLEGGRAHLPERPPSHRPVLLEAGGGVDLAAVCSQLGTETESVEELSLADLPPAASTPLGADPCRTRGLPLIGWAASKAAERNPLANLAWGLPDGAFAHRPVVTKPSARRRARQAAAATAGVLWDVGPAAPSASNRHSCALG